MGLKRRSKTIDSAKVNELPKQVDSVALSAMLNVTMWAAKFPCPKVRPKIMKSAANSARVKVAILALPEL